MDLKYPAVSEHKILTPDLLEIFRLSEMHLGLKGVDLSNIRVLNLFHDSTAKEIHCCISTPGQYCVVSFPVHGK